MPRYIAAVNLVGPNAELVPAETPLPEDWDPEYVADLVRSGGAVEVDDADTVDEALGDDA